MHWCFQRLFPRVEVGDARCERASGSGCLFWTKGPLQPSRYITLHTLAPQLARRKANITVHSTRSAKSPRQRHNSHEMPPRKQKQIASASASISSNELIPSFPVPSAMLPTKTGEEETHTPERSPAKRGAMTITEAQKQALMDNLQLEGKALQDRSRLRPV